MVKVTPMHNGNTMKRLATLIALAVTAPMTLAQQPAGTRVTPDGRTATVRVELADPARAARVILDMVSGGIVVKGSNRRDVVVTGRGRGDAAPRADANAQGLRRLSQTPGFSVEERRNDVVIEPASPNRTIDFEIQVPLRTNLTLETVNEGQVVVEDVEGDIEVSNVNGNITLTRVAGSAVADTINGRILATLTRGTADRPMAFTAFNGNVDVTLPASLKATLRLLSEMGDVYSDFNIQPRPAAPVQSRRRGGRFQIDVNKTIYGEVNGGGPEIELRTFNGAIYARKAP
jgi:hypothetical protein